MRFFRGQLFAMRFVAIALVLVLGVGVGVAGNVREAREALESSVLVSGWIEIGIDGSVESHGVDAKAPLGPDILRLIDNAASRWRFEPVMVDGVVRRVKTPMYLRLVAKAAGPDQYSVGIRSVQFGKSEEEGPPSATLNSVTLTPPRYPRSALAMGAKGTAYVLLRVGRDGRVEEVATEQVNLRVLGTSQQLESAREAFASAAERAARNWRFTPPTTGPAASEPYWLARVPVDFVFKGEPTPGHGQWDTYVPGPRNPVPWAREPLRTAGNPDALPPGRVFLLGGSPKLLNPDEAG